MKAIIALVLLLGCVPAFGQAVQVPEKLQKQIDEMDAEPFLGAPSVGLLVTPSSGLIDLDLTAEKLQRPIEIVLRRNGIGVHSPFEKTPNSGFLSIHALVKFSTRGRYVYSVMVRYDEFALPTRQLAEHVKADSTKIGISATLWHREEFGEASAATVAKEVSDLCEGFAAEFALAYLRANPRH